MCPRCLGFWGKSKNEFVAQHRKEQEYREQGRREKAEIDGKILCKGTIYDCIECAGTYRYNSSQDSQIPTAVAFEGIKQRKGGEVWE